MSMAAQNLPGPVIKDQDPSSQSPSEEEGQLGGLFGALAKLFQDKPKVAKAITGIAGSLAASALNDTSAPGAQGLARAANAAASCPFWG